MTTITPEKPAPIAPRRRERRPRKSESVKDRPQTIEQLQLAIEAGRLDGRTLAAKKMTEARAVISADPVGASRILLTDALAQSTAVLMSITNVLSRPGVRVLDESGNLTPIVEALFRSQDNLRRTVSTLMKLDGKGAGTPRPDTGTGGGTIADIILEAQHDANTD
ncbi:MAG: hypothetical protein FWH34_01065 [Desulfovibrionaceae bacterium]|nr:hypothetical protein [Desulfovibrionaceae bacterium]